VEDSFCDGRRTAGQDPRAIQWFSNEVSCRALEMNFSTGPGGSVRVELQDAAGRPLPGFTAADASPMTGDEISRISHRSQVRWCAGARVSLRLDFPVGKK
jgi:hypothetical protein